MGDVLRSALLSRKGFSHAFNLRTGGASAAPYDSFNLGRVVGDSEADVEENHRRFASAAGYSRGRLYELSQVHGNAAHVVHDEEPALLRQTEGDALIGPPGGRAVGVRVADCVPVLLADPATGRVAAVHAGWRGTVRGVLESTVAALLAEGSRAGDLHAAIFPHIRRCCFEVGDDVASELGEACPGADAIDTSHRKPHVDLAAIVTTKLLQLELAQELIDDVPGCTRCEPGRFFSYRRDGKRSGRHLAAIVSR